MSSPGAHSFSLDSAGWSTPGRPADPAAETEQPETTSSPEGAVLRRIKVLLLIDRLALGGTEQSILDIARKVEFTDVVVCTIYQNNPIAAEFRAAGIEVIALDLAGKYRLATAVRAVRRIVQARNIDLIHSSLYRAGLVARIVSRLAGLPVVDSFVSDSYSAIRRRSMPLGLRLKFLVVWGFDLLTSRCVTHFVANSQAVKVSNAKALALPLKRITVINRGRDPGAFRRRSVTEVHLLRSRLGLGARPAILHVARLRQGKGQLELVRAMAIVRATVPDAQLLVAGEGELRKDLEALIDHLDLHEAVTLLGARRDIPELMAVASAFALPSHYEGQSGALIEAMFAGLPIVATDIPENRESVTHMISALLVPVSSVQRLAQALCTVLQDPEMAQAMGSAALATAHQRFEIGRIAQAHERLYRQVAAVRDDGVRAYRATGR